MEKNVSAKKSMYKEIKSNSGRIIIECGRTILNDLWSYQYLPPPFPVVIPDEHKIGAGRDT